MKSIDAAVILSRCVMDCSIGRCCAPVLLLYKRQLPHWSSASVRRAPLCVFGLWGLSFNACVNALRGCSASLRDMLALLKAHVYAADSNACIHRSGVQIWRAGLLAESPLKPAPP